MEPGDFLRIFEVVTLDIIDGSFDCLGIFKAKQYFQQ